VTLSTTSSAKELVKEVAERGLETVRFAFADQHGLLHGKSIAAAEVAAALENGVGFPSTLLMKDTAGKTVFPVFSAGAGLGIPELQGAADAVMVADPRTFKVLPWAPGTGWVLCDLRFPNGKPVPFDTRGLLRRTLADLQLAGYGLLAGLEIEFHIFRLLDPRLRPEDAGQPGTPPEVALLANGYHLLSELRYDQMEAALEILRANLAGLGLPLRSFEMEFGPSQVEVTLAAMDGLAAADAMVLLRSATKQILRRHGYHATFMCRPKLPNLMSSGWHLHQSLLAKDGGNAFMPGAGEILSPLGMQFLGGLIEHARASAAFSTPTINGYKRYRPYALAPDSILWAKDNRGVMIRVLGGPGDPGSRIENRIGEPAANPYLYFASQVVAGMDGVTRKLDPGSAAETPYDKRGKALPASLAEALDALRADAVLKEGLGATFVDYYCRIKQAELARFNLEVTDWEQREYFELY